MRSHVTISACIGVCLFVSLFPMKQQGTRGKRAPSKTLRKEVRSGGHPVSNILTREFRPELMLDSEIAGMQEAWELLGRGDAEGCRKKIAEYFYSQKPKHAIEPWPSYENAQFRADEFLKNRYILGTHTVQDLPDDLNWRENPAGLDNWGFLLHALDILRSVNDAYRLTGDTRYIVKGKGLIIDFAEDNLNAKSIPSRFSWYDVAVAYRTIYLLDFWNHYMDLKEADESFTLLFIELLWRQGLYLVHERFYSKSTNHGMYSNIALLRLARAFPEYFDSAHWKEVAVSRMEQQVRDNYTGDGLHREYSPSYHVLTARLLIRFQTDCSGDRDITFSDKFDTKFRKIMTNVPYLFHPDGMLSIIGDSRLVSAEGMLRFFPANDSCLDYVRTNGKRGKPPQQDSKAFPEAQMFVMRSGWGRFRPYGEETCLIADFTSYGLAHQHYDFMSFELCGRGYRWVTDLGPLTYNKNDPRRKYLVSGPAHNILVPYTRRAAVEPGRTNSDITAWEQTTTDAKRIVARIEQTGMMENAQDRIDAYVVLLNYNAGEHEDKILILIALSYQEVESGTEKSREYLEKIVKKGPQSEYYAVAKEVLATLGVSADEMEFVDEPAEQGIDPGAHGVAGEQGGAAAESGGFKRINISSMTGDETKQDPGGTAGAARYTSDAADKVRVPTVDHWISNADFDYLEGRFAYNKYFTHSRAILFIKPHCFLIVDGAKANRACMIKQFFHMPPQVEVAERGNGYMLSVGDSMRCLLVRLSSPSNAESRVVEGETEPEMQGWYAGVGRIFKEAPVIEYSFKTDGGHHYFAHLFVPLGTDDAGGYEVDVANGDMWNLDANEPLVLTIHEPHRSTEVSFFPSRAFLMPQATLESMGPSIQVIRTDK